MTEKTKSAQWKTAITKVEPNRILVHGYAIDEMMGNITYAGSVYLLLRGELPSKKTEKMLDTILVSSVDHGVTPPSVLSALTCASTGGNLSQSMACAILSINQFHGGAIENCQKMLYEGVARMKREGLTVQEAGERTVRDLLEEKKTLFGLGHRIHTKDPRKEKLFDSARQLEFYSDYCRLLEAMAEAFARIKGKDLPINVDGAIGAILCEMGFPAHLGNAFFMIARMPGILAHFNEEKERQKPMRRINPAEYEYDGPEYREYPFDY